MSYNLCIIKPNKSVYSETFIQNHIDHLNGNISVLYGGSFPIYQQNGDYLISSKLVLLSYLFQKRILRKKNIKVKDQSLINYLKTQKIDVVLAEYGMVGASVYKACMQAKVPLVIHFHGADAHHQPTLAKYSKAYKAAFEYASSVVCVSEFMFEALIKLGVNKNKLVLNPYGVNLDAFKITQPQNNLPILLFVGRFVEKKAPEILVKAFAMVKKEVPDSKLIMAGMGPLLSKCKEIALNFGLQNDIEFPGVYKHEQVISQMKLARAFVQHSVIAKDGDSEGTPNSILEASASGLPVISTFHAGIKEAVVDKLTGLLSPEYDIKTFAGNMITVLKDKEYAQNLGQKGAEHIKKNYDLKSQILNLDKIIQKAITTHD